MRRRESEGREKERWRGKQKGRELARRYTAATETKGKSEEIPEHGLGRGAAGG